MPKNPTNPVVKYSTLHDGETEWKLVFTFNALARAEAATGQNCLHALNLQSTSISQLRALLYATLMKFHSKVTVEQAGDILEQVGIQNAIVAILEAWSLSRPPADPRQPEADADADPASK